ncbi:MAG: hypothetical protein FWC41_09595 [Firmicutes bacterium]|nr:hypothetical protein [Bacillota bacterium]
MRIIKLDEFIKLPENTLYMKYEPYVFDELCIKYDSTDYDDWYYRSFVEVLADSSEGFWTTMEKAAKNGTEVRLDFDICSRDAMFEKDQLFCVFSDNDILNMIKSLKKCLGVENENS